MLQVEPLGQAQPERGQQAGLGHFAPDGGLASQGPPHGGDEQHGQEFEGRREVGLVQKPTFEQGGQDEGV